MHTSPWKTPKFGKFSRKETEITVKLIRNGSLIFHTVVTFALICGTTLRLKIRRYDF
jgi:hypothetical protein